MNTKLLCIVFVFFIAFNAHADNMDHQEKYITIFIAGSVGNSLRLKYFSSLFKENIEKTPYYQETVLTRDNPTWTRHHPAQNGRGLNEINMTKATMSAAQLFASMYDRLQRIYYPHQSTLAYYTFDWSGAINHNERVKAGKQFYYQLKQEVARLRAVHGDFKIRIIAYSHGGNVALIMAQHCNEDPEPIDFVIDELIMIATPTQRETDFNVMDDFFIKPYVIYSRADHIQKMDCFSTCRLFSGRRFKDSSRCLFRDKVQHIELKITVAVENDPKLNRYPSKKRIDRSPGHIELWYFAQLCQCPFGSEVEYCLESKFYRYYFPLEPLPAAILVPALIKAAQERSEKNLIIETQPDTGYAFVRERHCRNTECIEFITPEMIESLRKSAMPYLTATAASCTRK